MEEERKERLKEVRGIKEGKGREGEREEGKNEGRRKRRKNKRGRKDVVIGEEVFSITQGRKERKKIRNWVILGNWLNFTILSSFFLLCSIPCFRRFLTALRSYYKGL